MARSARHAIAALGLVMAAAVGCRGILGIQVYEADDCIGYCDTLTDKCSKQFASKDACLAYCLHIPVGTSPSGNTLACRMDALDMLELRCATAGPAGDPGCGSICESYCTGLQDLCRTQMDLKYGKPLAHPPVPPMDGCLADCKSGALQSCGPYGGSVHDHEPSFECRLFHLTNVAAEPTGGHCEHAIGIGNCEPGPQPCNPK